MFIDDEHAWFHHLIVPCQPCTRNTFPAFVVGQATGWICYPLVIKHRADEITKIHDLQVLFPFFNTGCGSRIYPQPCFITGKPIDPSHVGHSEVARSNPQFHLDLWKTIASPPSFWSFSAWPYKERRPNKREAQGGIGMTGTRHVFFKKNIPTLES